MLFAGTHRDHLAARPDPHRAQLRAGRRRRVRRRRAMMMAASLTLLPALLRLVGHESTTRPGRRSSPSVSCVVAAIVGVTHRSQRRSSSEASLLAIVFFAASFAIRPLRQPRAAPADPAATGTAGLVPVEPLHPAPPVAVGDRRRGRPPPARAAAVLDPARLRRHRQLPRGADGAPGVRPARRGLRARLQRPAPRHGRRAPPPTTPPRSDEFGRRPSNRPTDVAFSGFRAPITGGSRARHRVPRERAAGRGHRRARRTTCATTSIPASGVDAKVGGFTAASTDFAELPRRPPAAAHRRRAVCSASCC